MEFGGGQEKSTNTNAVLKKNLGAATEKGSKQFVSNLNVTSPDPLGDTRGNPK